MATENTNLPDTDRRRTEAEKLLLEMELMKEARTLKQSSLFSLVSVLFSGLAGLAIVLMFFRREIQLGPWTLTVVVVFGVAMLIALITQVALTARASQKEMERILESHKILTERLSADIKATKGNG